MSRFRHTAMHNARHVIYQTHPPNMEVFSSAKFPPDMSVLLLPCKVPCYFNPIHHLSIHL